MGCHNERSKAGGLALEGFDVVLEMSGVPSAIHQAFALVRVGGRVQMLGIPAKPMEVNFASEVIFKGLTIYGVVGRRMYDTWHQMTRFLRSGEFDPGPVITHRFPMSAADEAIRAELDRRYEEVATRFGEDGDVPLPPHWGGFRVVPDVYEFWQHGENRLHDRVRYGRDGNGWRESASSTSTGGTSCGLAASTPPGRAPSPRTPSAMPPESAPR